MAKTTPESKAFAKKLKENLGRDFKVQVSRNCLNVQIWYKFKENDDWTRVNNHVAKVAKIFKLDEVGAGTMIETCTRDWEFVNLAVEKAGAIQADKIIKDLQDFFKKYPNFTESLKIYEKVDKMRQIVGEDEM